MAVLIEYTWCAINTPPYVDESGNILSYMHYNVKAAIYIFRKAICIGNLAIQTVYSLCTIIILVSFVVLYSIPPVSQPPT